MASMSSQLYGACVTALLEDLSERQRSDRLTSDAAVTPEGPVRTGSDCDWSTGRELKVDLDDEVVRGAIVLHEGKCSGRHR